MQVGAPAGLSNLIKVDDDNALNSKFFTKYFRSSRHRQLAFGPMSPITSAFGRSSSTECIKLPVLPTVRSSEARDGVRWKGTPEHEPLSGWQLGLKAKGARCVPA